MSINLQAVYHEAKSRYAYAYDKESVHIRIRTAKNNVDNIRFIYGDPFNWGKKKSDKNSQESDEYGWLYESGDSLYMKKEYSTDLFDHWFISVKPKYRRMKYCFILEKGEECVVFGSRKIDLNLDKHKLYDLSNYFNFPFINEADLFKAPEWVKDTVWYQIFPERFNNGNKENDPIGTLPWGSIVNVRNNMFFGGDLQGVIDKLDYIKSLGANGIYFTPIFKSPSNHKYDTIDYYEIDPQFGDIKTVRTLIIEAHKRGIRVMLDAVFNHCGFYHPFFQDVLKNGEDSPYKNYFHIKEFPVFDFEHPRQFKFVDGENELKFDTFAFTPSMPKWNTDNPDVVNYLLKVGEYWIKDLDIDAWRLDVSNEVDHNFWKKFRQTCDKAKKDFFIVGENWDDANPWIQPDQMQSVMNYQFNLPVLDYFGRGNINSVQFVEQINKVLTSYPKNVIPYLFNLLDSHDTTRILTICDGNIQKTKLAFVFLMTFAGTPSIYYGDEIGLAGGHDPDNRRCMIWDEDYQDLDIFKHIQTLVSLRKFYKAFTDIDLIWVDYNEQTNHIVYKKHADDITIYVIMNNSDNNLSITVDEIGELVTTNLFTGDKYNHNIFNLEPYGFFILKLN